jgi:hypothetical protein
MGGLGATAFGIGADDPPGGRCGWAAGAAAGVEAAGIAVGSSVFAVFCPHPLSMNARTAKMAMCE